MKAKKKKPAYNPNWLNHPAVKVAWVAKQMGMSYTPFYRKAANIVAGHSRNPSEFTPDELAKLGDIRQKLIAQLSE